MPIQDFYTNREVIDPLDVWRFLKASGVKYVKFVIIDIFGRPKCEILDISKARDGLIDGVPFDGSSIPQYAYVNDSDFVAVPDLKSVYIESWNGGRIALIFTFVKYQDKYSLLDTRYLLAKTLDELRVKGFDFKVGVEIEYFLVREVDGKPILADQGVYFEAQNVNMLSDVVYDIVSSIDVSGISIIKTHHEVAPSQYEVDIEATNPLRLADTIIVTKMLIKDVANRHGLVATFMPKPFWGINGSGAHIHLSIWRNNENLFKTKEITLTETCKYALGGLLKYAKDISAVVAPLVNSYKRLTPHYEAPTRITWGFGNRSTLVRVPIYRGYVDRIEYRHPDPSMNPYLGLLTIILAMMRGLTQKIEPPEPTREIAYELSGVEELPQTIEKAVKVFSGSDIAKELPRELVDRYVTLKLREWSSYVESEGPWEKTWNKITDWEYKTYLKVV